MKLFRTITDWLDTNGNIAYTLIRIFLGGALFVRGAIVSSDPASLTQLAGSPQYYWWYSYIIVIHITCGFFLAIGLITRFAAIAQIPILFVAVFFIHLKKGLMNVGQSLELSALVLVLLAVYCIFGAGSIFFDTIIKRKKLKMI